MNWSVPEWGIVFVELFLLIEMPEDLEVSKEKPLSMICTYLKGSRSATNKRGDENNSIPLTQERISESLVRLAFANI